MTFFMCGGMLRPNGSIRVKYFQYFVFYSYGKQNLNPPIFRNTFTHRAKPKYALRNENSIQEPLCQTNFS